MKGAFSIIILMLCYFLANSIYVAVLGEVAAGFDASSQATKATVSAYQLGAVFACIISSLCADRIGKLRFLNIGLFLAITGSLGCGFAASIDSLIAARFVQGAGAGIGFTMGFALATDLYKAEETLKIIAINGITVSAASTIAPSLGAILTGLMGWHAVFFVITGLYLLVLVNSQLRFPARVSLDRSSPTLKQTLTELRKLFSSVRFLCYAWLNGVFLLGLFATLTMTPFYLSQQLGLNPTQIGLFIGICSWSAFGSASLSSVLLYRKLGTDGGIRVALSLSALGTAIMLAAAWGAPLSLAAIALAVTLFHLGFGLLYSGSITESLRVFPSLSVKASSVRTIFLAAGSFLGAAIAQGLDDQQLSNLALIYLGVVLGACLLFLCRQRGRQDAPGD